MYKIISVIDIDETVFNTFSTIGVLHSGVRVKGLNNQEYNKYVLKKGEDFDFSQFKDSKFFYDTSIPIVKSVFWIAKLIKNIEKNQNNSNHLLLFLSARSLPNDYNEIYDKFEMHNMKVRNPNIHFAFTGEMDMEKYPTNPIKKARVLEWYLTHNKNISTIRMFDDDRMNLIKCAEMAENYSNKEKKDMKFYAMHVLKDGLLQRI